MECHISRSRHSLRRFGPTLAAQNLHLSSRLQLGGQSHIFHLGRGHPSHAQAAYPKGQNFHQQLLLEQWSQTILHLNEHWRRDQGVSSRTLDYLA